MPPPRRPGVSAPATAARLDRPWRPDRWHPRPPAFRPGAAASPAQQHRPGAQRPAGAAGRAASRTGARRHARARDRSRRARSTHAAQRARSSPTRDASRRPRRSAALCAARSAARGRGTPPARGDAPPAECRRSRGTVPPSGRKTLLRSAPMRVPWPAPSTTATVRPACALCRGTRAAAAALGDLPVARRGGRCSPGATADGGTITSSLLRAPGDRASPP